MINKTINGYTIKHLIGSGGMAEVYYAENSLGFPAAIKVLKIEFSQHAQVQERFINEAKIMKSLNHPYIRKVMDLGNIDGQACIIMEYLEGRTLKELMQSGKRIKDASLQKYFDQCAQALIFTHAQKITHRDIKPSNIFITNSDEVRLVDFGIAKSDLTLSKTITGQTLGTVMYMSSEQVADPKRVTGKTDIYSLGVTFYHVLTGTPPYDARTGSEFKIQQKIVYEDLDISRIPSHWKGLLAGCLLKKPEDRPGLKAKNFDGQTIIDDLHPPKRDSKPIKFKPWLVGACIGLALLFGGIWLGNNNQPVKELTLAQHAANEIAATMVRIPGGNFMMGCTDEQGDDCYDDERPAHQRKVNTFSINKFEVTQEQWEAIMGTNPSNFRNCDRCPVENVSWYDAQEFIRKLNSLTGNSYRLPTEPEWEYAARGGQDYKYAGSNTINNVAWYGENSGRKTRPVGQKSSNAYGLYDMSGNVLEWCSDWFKGYPGSSGVSDFTGSSRINRGGDHSSRHAEHCRVSVRGAAPPDNIGDGILGFRVAR